MDRKKSSPSFHAHEFHHDKCFGCGLSNPIGLKADFTYNEELNEVKFIYNFRRDYNGAPGFVHGGAISTLLDEAMGDLCFHLGYIVMTDEMTFKFHKATPIESDLLVRGWFIRKEKRKIHLECKLTKPDESLSYVEGYGSFHILSPRFFSKKIDGGHHAFLNEVLEENRRARSDKYIKEIL
ncbi:MAG: PaaI family thioesterase [Leptospira sp.]|nr:PaaI family thioesterase [Leptospira sp.]